MNPVVRQLVRFPAFTAAASLTLALGIGATTAVFSVANAVLLRPLAFRDPDRLVRIDEGRPNRRLNVSLPNFLDWRERARSFEDMAVCRPFGRAVETSGPRAEVVSTATAEARLFALLGIAPALGRSFAPDEERPGGPPAAVISHAFWQRRFAGAASAVGHPLVLDGQPVTVVGVLPAEFRLFTAAVVLPLGARLREIDADRGSHGGFFAYARLRGGVDLDRARAEMSGIAADLARQHPLTNTDLQAFVTPMAEFLLGGSRSTLQLLAAAVGMLLLIGCANVAGILVARGLQREREIAIRAALGAGRARLVRLFLAEGCAIALLGGTFGVLLASWTVRVLHATDALVLPRAADVAIDPATIAFALALSAATVLLFALAPALHLSRVDPMRSLRQAGPAVAPASGARMRATLLAVEVALSLMLVVAATLMLRTVARLTAVHPGYEAERLLAVDIAQPAQEFTDAAALVQFADLLVAELRTLPGVADAALAFAPGPFWTPKINRRDEPRPAGQEAAPFASSVTPSYFATMGIPVKEGRTLGAEDRAGAPVAAVVNQAFVREVLGRGRTLGVRLTALGIPEMADMEIVGVVGDTRRQGAGLEPGPELYVSYAQMPVSDPTILVRASRGDPRALARAVDARVAAVDRGVPTLAPRRLADELDRSIASRRTLMTLLGCFAALALVLTAIGIGGVVSFTVAQRTPEIGVRLALGATPSAVRRLVMRGAIAPMLVGAAAGAAGSIPASRLIRGFLYQVAPSDPAATIAGIATLLLAGALAAYLPARRATRVDPVAALRL